MFDFLKKQERRQVVAPVKGEAVSIHEVSDPTFGKEILGKGIAIKPAENKFYAPVDGIITLLFDTLHAISITSSEGAEILIHIGIDTVSLKGAHYTAHVKTGDTVKKGDLLLTAELDAIRAAGYEVITSVVICNTEEYEDVSVVKMGYVEKGDVILEIVTNNFMEMSKIILEGVGGKDNVVSIGNCMTRLRLEIKDHTLVNEAKIVSAGVAGIIRPSKTAVQVVIGIQVQFVADEFKKLCK